MIYHLLLRSNINTHSTQYPKVPQRRPKRNHRIFENQIKKESKMLKIRGPRPRTGVPCFQSVSQLFHGPAPRSNPSQSGSATPGRTRSNTSTEYSFPGATVLFQISTADKTHVFIPCVCPVLVSVLFRFSRADTPHPVLFLEGRFTLGRCTLSRLIEFRAPPAAQAARPRPAAAAARGPRPRAGVPSTF